ncbi:helix-turn-helix domain-containing protein [Microbacterium sp. NPDC089190]|uniref:helix-turn-helix transcriptional regulator n=1 Tax=Microbacterium sp. NPDC089190 TaxID=3155063 RepID=UPI00344CBED4
MSDQIELREYSTREQIADFLQVKKQTLAVWAVEGKGPKFIKVGRAVRYRRADVMAWLDSPAR